MEQIPHWVSDEELIKLALLSDDPLLRRLAELCETQAQTIRDLEEEIACA